MKTSKTTVYIKCQQGIYGFKLTNIYSQCDFDIYTGEIIQVKREIVTLENPKLI